MIDTRMIDKVLDYDYVLFPHLPFEDDSGGAEQVLSVTLESGVPALNSGQRWPRLVEKSTAADKILSAAA